MAVPGVALLLLALGAGPADTLSFATPATRALMERAMARHRAQESAVTDYRAQARFRVSFALGRRAWSRPPTMAVEEIDATVHWQAPNDMRVDLLGRRARARHDDMDLRTFFDRPWFFPRQVGDSVRLFGGDFPERAAVHPLAAAGPAHYRYAITDSQRVRLPDGGAIRLQRVEVRPRTVAPALVAGYLWLDQDSGEVVRFTFRFVGEELWETPDGDTPRDSADARKANQFVNRILEIEADLEYGLQEGRYWMPYRQAVSGRGRIWSFIEVHPPVLPAFMPYAPYPVVLVELEEAVGLRLVGNVVHQRGAGIDSVNLSELEIGRPVTALIDQLYAQVEKTGGRRWDTSSLIHNLRLAD